MNIELIIGLVLVSIVILLGVAQMMSVGTQGDPMMSKDEGYTVELNGAVYNFSKVYADRGSLYGVTQDGTTICVNGCEEVVDAQGRVLTKTEIPVVSHKRYTATSLRTGKRFDGDVMIHKEGLYYLDNEEIDTEEPIWDNALNTSVSAADCIVEDVK